MYDTQQLAKVKIHVQFMPIFDPLPPRLIKRLNFCQVNFTIYHEDTMNIIIMHDFISMTVIVQNKIRN